MAFRTLSITRRGGGSNKVTVKPDGENSTAIVIGRALLTEMGWEQGEKVNVMIGEGDDEGVVMVQRDEDGLRKISTTASPKVTMPRRTLGFLDPELKYVPEHSYDEEEDALTLDFSEAEGAELSRRSGTEEDTKPSRTATKTATKRTAKTKAKGGKRSKK